MAPPDKTDSRPVDSDKLRPKLHHIRDSLRRLEDLKSRTEEEFISDLHLEPAATRNLQTAIEAVIDIANHIVAREGLGIPQSYRDAINLIVDHGILPEGDRDQLLNMVRFRNRAVHLYDSIEPREVYKILQTRLGDFERFMQAIVKRYLS